MGDKTGNLLYSSSVFFIDSIVGCTVDRRFPVLMGFVKKCNAYLLYIRYFLSKILDIKRCLRGLVNCLRSDFVNTSFSFHGLRLDCHWPNGDAAL